MTNRWMLPEGVDEALPPVAKVLEGWRRQLVDLYAAWGYELCMPPMVEFRDSLLSGSGALMSEQTLTAVDPVSGKLLGLRADITPQAARIDAHRMQEEGVNRLSYISSVFRAKVEGLAGRLPLQAGCECFGSDSLAADIEVASLMAESLQILGFEPVLDLGHVGIYRDVMAQLELSEDVEQRFFALLQRKAIPEIREFVAALGASEAVSALLLAMPDWVGGKELLQTAREQLLAAGVTATALDELSAMGTALNERYPELQLNYDLGELRGYSYHTGVVFAAFVPGVGSEAARGGRYDHVGEAFGRARAATGFSLDLRVLAKAANKAADAQPAARNIIAAPNQRCSELFNVVQTLRAAGETVVVDIDGGLSADRKLEKQNDSWEVVSA